MQSGNSLINQLLIAMPGMADPNFNSTVTLICEHNEEGALGIVINRPGTMTLGGLLQQFAVEEVAEGIASEPVLHGGPVAGDRGFVLHPPTGDYLSSVAVSSNIQLTLSRDVLESLAAGGGPEQSLVALGYAGWEPGQLENEMLQNTWLNVDATPALVFEVPFADRWARAAASMGIDINQISPHAGHA